jgi:hypothetical protein
VAVIRSTRHAVGDRHHTRARVIPPSRAATSPSRGRSGRPRLPLLSASPWYGTSDECTARASTSRGAEAASPAGHRAYAAGASATAVSPARAAAQRREVPPVATPMSSRYVRSRGRTGDVTGL